MVESVGPEGAVGVGVISGGLAAPGVWVLSGGLMALEAGD